MGLMMASDERTKNSDDARSVPLTSSVRALVPSEQSKELEPASLAVGRRAAS